MRQNNFAVDVHKTDKVSVNEESHGLPPSNGTFSEFRVADYFCPEEWSKDAVFIPVKEGDPMWFDLRHNDECACLPSIQRLNPVTGDPANLDDGLVKDPAQNYLALPIQKWIDGYAKDGKVYQFVVTKRGIGLAVNEFVLPEHMQDSHAIGFAFFGPKNPKPKVVYKERGSYPSYPGHLGGITKIGTKAMWTSKALRSHGGGMTLGASGSVGPTFGDISGLDSVDSADGLDMGGIEDFAVSCDSGAEAASTCFYSAENIEVKDCDLTAGVDEALEPIDAPDVVDMMEETKLQDLDKASMGMGGRIEQTIILDENTVDHYHEKPDAVLTIYFALPDMFKTIMDKGRRQDSSRKDKYKMSGEVGGVQVPLIVGEAD